MKFKSILFAAVAVGAAFPSINGGLTKMTSLEWCRNLPQMEELQVFAEKIDDFSPISALPNLKYFRPWKMKTSAAPDISFLANCRKLERLELPGPPPYAKSCKVTAY